MAPAETVPATSLRSQRLNRALLFTLLFVSIYSFPLFPQADLDSAWRMSLGKYLLDGLQFGRDVVFTYGPLGFLMGKTYYGSSTLFQLMLVYQVIAGVAFALLIMLWGERLSGWSRLIYYGYFLLFGITYDDALHMLAIAMIGLDLLRRSGQPWRWTSGLMLLFTALLGVIKFTNLVLAIAVVVIVGAHELWHRRPRAALRVSAWFAPGFLGFWVMAAQNPLNLPAYFRNAWNISQGYQEVMGVYTPPDPYWKALVVIGLLLAYFVFNLLTQKDRAKSVAYIATLGAFLYLNWKHGFVRSDGHIVGFFYCALLPIVAFPGLLEDGIAWRRWKRLLLIPAGILCIIGVRDTLTGVVDGALALWQGKIWTNGYNVAHLPALRGKYNEHLAAVRTANDLPRTRESVGDHSIDVIGYDQHMALFNKLNYVPRPVIQSYSAYTPELAQLNADFYASERAPDFALVRVQSIDERMSGVDDAATLYLIAHRYTFRQSEKGYQLWEKNPGPFDRAALAPKPVTTKTVHVGEDWLIEQYATQPLWLTVDLPPSLLGRIRNFFYKPPLVYFAVQDKQGNSTTYRLPTPLGRAGFVVSPLIEDGPGYINFAGGKAERVIRSVRLHIAPEDLKYFAGTAEMALSSLVTPHGADAYVANVNIERFFMFYTVPASFDAQAPPSQEVIDGVPTMIMHAPSEMIFNLKRGATELTGKFGFLSGAYLQGGRTNGADFTVVWSDGKGEIELFRRFLDPLNRADDRGLQSFKVNLEGRDGGRLYLRIGPGPYNDHGWDWTGWTAIKIK